MAEKFEGNPGNPKELSFYSQGTIEHQKQPEGGRELSEYEKQLLFDRQELEEKAVLDLGTGPEAKLAKQLEESGVKAEVISMSPDFLQKEHRVKAKESFPEGNFVAGTGQALPFKDKSIERVQKMYNSLGELAEGLELDDEEFKEAWKHFEEGKGLRITLLGAEYILPLRDSRYSNIVREVRKSDAYKKRVEAEKKGVSQIFMGTYGKK